ncbi:MAG TPA: DNA translocase FtsK [Aestuariivirgaceae bacterium]|nr:DNA translocase FtsK [Aestuariivirgaceae bacterium]
MSFSGPVDTDDNAVPAALRAFFRNRVLEGTGLAVLAVNISLSLALATWSPADPSLTGSGGSAALNWFGPWGATLSDALMRLLGLGTLGLLAVPTVWAMELIAHKLPQKPLRRMLAWAIWLLVLTGFLSLLPQPAGLPFAEGLGGTMGSFVSASLLWVLSFGLKGTFAAIVSAVLLGFVSLSAFFWAINHPRINALLLAAIFGERTHDVIDASVGALGHFFYSLVSAFGRARSRLQTDAGGHRDSISSPGMFRRLWTWLFSPAATAGEARHEPQLPKPRLAKPARQKKPELREDADVAEEDDGASIDDEAEGSDEQGEGPRISRSTKQVRQSKGAGKGGRPVVYENFNMPTLSLLAEPKHVGRSEQESDELLEQNARMLESVLDDFGVRGEIINVRPGPVVTLYELEPAPGIKSSRVIGLADDIARSMSAVAARVAVVPGRNAIGIELPNARREMVFLRELLGSEPFEKTAQSLCLALGKNIGGEPVFADLSRMPHLLIAGTTGSGKSVGINTMILSLLYRMPPEKCKLIMIDPKMLELSVYEGIPHLLAPVVTDPKKAVVALKWAVREMEDRYRKMSKLGVRNIDGYNARVQQNLGKGLAITRKVQTGYDPATGQPIFEEEEIDLQPMPFIVVIIDEMADLMMVAGKDIEGAVQRLAQMARAAGIHVVMATQRPSVDVITGTIKANFPTRVSFQVTSKIDSRTILGEQGAEQLLGQGDMLYMAGGGRIIRLHGPFVSDEEVEKIVRFLKSQGAPEYVDAVTEEPEGEEYGSSSLGSPEGGSGDELYDQAVAVVLRDKKVSTSYVQRRLQIGYNKAASLIERMEKEGVITPANATGKREILVGNDAV